EAARVLEQLTGVKRKDVVDIVREQLCLQAEKEKDLQVRYQLAVALGIFPGSEEVLLERLSVEKDAGVRYALVKSLKQAPDWKTVAQSAYLKKYLEDKEFASRALIPALTEEFDVSAVALLANLLQHG